MKILTLIPAYKTKYLADLIRCLRFQTLKPSRVIISDDSPDGFFLQQDKLGVFKQYLCGTEVEVVQGPRRGGFANFSLLARQAQDPEFSDYGAFHFLLDDDLIYPSFYKEHALAHAQSSSLCVISRRWTVEESGAPIDDLPVPVIVAENSSRVLEIDAGYLWQSTCGDCKNWLGEFSNFTFKMPFAKEVMVPNLFGVRFDGLEDLGGALKAARYGRIVYINAHLGGFRRSPNQNSSDPMGLPLKLAFLAYASLIILGRRGGVLPIEMYLRAIDNLRRFVVQVYSDQADMAPFVGFFCQGQGVDAFEAGFLALWNEFLLRKTGR